MILFAQNCIAIHSIRNDRTIFFLILKCSKVKIEQKRFKNLIQDHFWVLVFPFCMHEVQRRVLIKKLQYRKFEEPKVFIEPKMFVIHIFELFLVMYERKTL